MRRIGMVSAVPEAGGRTVAALFACYLAEKEKKSPAVLELGTAGLYDRLGLDKHFAGRDFYEPGGPENRLWGVNWQVKPPGKEQKDSLARVYGLARTLDRVEGDAVICLFNGLEEKEKELLMQDMDRLVIVTDPLPSRLLGLDRERLKKWKNAQKNAVTVVNKMNDGVKLHQVEDFLSESSFVTIPFLDPVWIYRAEFACKNPFAYDEVKKTVDAGFQTLWRILSQ